MIVPSDSTSCHEFASQFGLAIFVYVKNFQILGNIGWLARVVYFNDPATGYECQRCTSVATVVCVLAHACARVRWHACVRDVFEIYDNKI